MNDDIQLSKEEIKENEKKLLEIVRNPESEYHKLSTKERLWFEKVFVYGKSPDMTQNHKIQNMIDELKFPSPTQLIQQPKIKNAVTELYGPEINRGIVSKILLRAANAKKSYYDKDANELVESQVDDHKTQIEVAKLIVELHGDTNKSKNKQTSKTNLNINLQASDDVEDAVKEVLLKKWGTKNIQEAEIVQIDPDQQSD